MVVEAVTGSGKTLAFVVPIFEMLLKRDDKWKKCEIGALVITPTRELAQQIYDVVNVFLDDEVDDHDAFKGRFTSLLCVGGVGSVADDAKNLEENGANIVVATVGRLEDLLTRPSTAAVLKKCLKSLVIVSFELKAVFGTSKVFDIYKEVLILDEADRLLDMGFKESLESIFKVLPKQRRTGLFSATQTDEIDKLIRAGLRNPCNIQVKQKANPQKTPIGLHNYFMVNKDDLKRFDFLYGRCKIHKVWGSV